jgi:hypothetical protein
MTSKTEKKVGITERTEGTIHELQGQIHGSGSAEKIIVKFMTRDKQWITAAVGNRPGTYNPAGYRVGDKVSVIYNLYNPADFIIDIRRSESRRIFIALVGILFFTIGFLQLLS